MPHYKIIDYAHASAGELARLMLQFVDAEYDDVQLTNLEDILKAEAEAPLGKLPLLKVDGVTVAQSQGICRFLAREHGLIGKNNMDAVKCDMVMDGLALMFSKMSRESFSKLLPDEKKVVIESTLKVDLPRYLNMFENVLKKNGDDSKYFVGDELTWCDLGVCLVLATIRHRDKTLLDKQPLLQSLVDRVSELPKVQAFLKSRLGGTL